MTRTVTLPPEAPADAQGNKVGGWWHQAEGGKLVCDVCPRACKIAPGQRGFCFVRQNRDGQIALTTYGRSTGFCIDPIEKKPLNQFYPGTAVLSFGTAGCNLGCKFCQNWTSSKSRQVDAYAETASPEAIAEAARQLGCRSVAFTYNDPIIWIEYAIDVARACRAVGVKTVAVTSGYIAPGAREAFYEHIDAANVDLKAFTEDFYWKLSSGHLQPVLDTLRWLVHETGVWVEITNLIIPRANDSPEEIEGMCRWVLEELSPEVPVHFTAFHPDFKLTDRGPTPPATLAMAHEIAQRVGLRYAYTGNISDTRRQSTDCPHCGKTVIERDGYTLGEYALEGDRCRHCGGRVAGRYDRSPGNWGSRRQPVRIADFAPSRHNPTPSEGGRTMTSSQPDAADPQAEHPDRPKLTDRDEQLVLEAAGRRVVATVTGQHAEAAAALLEETGQERVAGAFVSLKQAGRLRSCCGFMGSGMTLAEAVEHAAIRAAKDDPRFPPISPTEIDALDMEVWLLWGMEKVAQRGEDRVAAVTIGKHGLQIARGSARGLLLPGVAVEHRLDARQFLEQTCIKAGLPPSAWKQDDTVLMRFEGYAVGGRLAEYAGPAQPSAPALPVQGQIAQLAEFCRGNLSAMLRGAIPNFYVTSCPDGNVSGVVLEIGVPGGARPLQFSKLSLRPDLPLQATVYNLTEIAARALRTHGVDADRVPSLSLALSVLSDPAMHGPADAPEIQGLDPKYRTVLVVQGSKSAWLYDAGASPEELLDEACQRVQAGDRTAARVFSFSTESTERRMMVLRVPRPESGPSVRPAAVAGMFYPAEPDEVDRMLDRMFAEPPRPEPWPAVMVPHAGWLYSGRLAAATYSRVAIPDCVIVVSPKHRAEGAEWAVAPHHTWSLPGREVASDPGLAARLAEAIEGLELDSAAHRREHAIEVQLPLLARLAPETRVVGIAMHGGSYEQLCRFAEQLAEVIRSLPGRPLLVISTDMNHFADEAENRRLDKMALDAICALDPQRLYYTVRDHHITMCGMVPAVSVMETLRRLEGLTRCEQVGYATSAEVSGDTTRVVGYAGVLLA